jgi:hypothetical protein
MAHLCWSRVREAEFDNGWLIQHWLFILIVLHVLQRRLRLRSASLAMVGCASAMAAPLIFSIATIPAFSGTLTTTLVFVCKH